MFTFNRIFAATALAVIGVNGALVFPADKGVPDSVDGALDLTGTSTDATTIDSTLHVVNQKAGAASDALPDLPPLDTVITAVDGNLTDAGTSFTGARRTRRVVPRTIPGRFARSAVASRADRYKKVFDGTGTYSRDCSVQGTAYLTYTVVSNSTYSNGKAECLDFCDRVAGCTFVNLYYEFNNPLLDWVFSEKSNLRCAAYGDVHSAVEKTNCGGQQLAPEGWGPSYIQQSSGYALSSLVKPPVPSGYDLVFGPIDGANDAPGYMGFVFLSSYDVNACAAECNKRGPDENGGACQYFNIWRALVNDAPTTYTCSMYFIPTDASTAVNYGQGDLKVTYSRGYARKSLVPDGNFEGYTCPGGGDFCYTNSYANWVGITPKGGLLDASIFHYAPYAHSGSSVGLLGSAYGTDALPGTLTPAKALATTAGKEYTIHFFHSSTFSGPQLQKDAFVDILWNGKIVETIRPGYSRWKYYEFKVTAKGRDVLAFHGGKAPAYSFIDNVYVFAV